MLKFLLHVLVCCCCASVVDAQRIVAIHQYDGTTCDETAIYPDEDVSLFRDVFGHEFLGGWERFTYGEIDTAEQFLDGTCFLYLDGFCDTAAFNSFYQLYYDSIQAFVWNGGRLYINNQKNFNYGFDSVESYIYNDDGVIAGGSSAFVYLTNHSIARAPFDVDSGFFRSELYSGTTPDFFVGAFRSNMSNDMDSILLDTLPSGRDSPLVRFSWGAGEVVLSSFYNHLWDELRTPYRNLRRNILYYLSGCVRGTQNAGIYHLLSPTPECNLTNAEELKVMVYNYGYDTISNVEACYRIEDGATYCEVFPITLPPQGFDTLVFATPADLSLCGYNTIEAWTQIPDDSDLSNDTLSWELRNICALITDSGIPDTVCIAAPVIQAHPQAGQGTWGGVGIVDSVLGLFDPALVGEDNYTVITYTYNMPIDYDMYPIDFEMPVLEEPTYLDLDGYDRDTLSLPFRFQFFNQQFDTVIMTSEGFLSFDNAVFSDYPYPGEAPNLIVWCGSNLNPEVTGEIKVEVQGAIPNRKWIVHFDDVYTSLVPGQTMNVAAILYEADGTIEFQVDKIPALYEPGNSFWQYIVNEDFSLIYNTAGTNDLSFNKWSDGANDTAFRFEPILCSRTITDTIFVTGNVNVPVLGNDTTFCPGGELTIGTDYPGTNHLWNTGDTTSHIIITEGGTYTLQLHYGPGDCWLYDTITVTAEEQNMYEEVLGTDTTLCYGDSLIIELPEGYLSYSWGSGITDSTLIITDAQIISVELEYASGCSLYDSINISYHNEILVDFEVTPSPDSGPGGNIIVLSSNGTPPYTITWNDGFLSGDTIIGTWPGTYVLTIADANGCSVEDSVVVPIGTAIEQASENIAVYPNPFTDQLVLQSSTMMEQINVFTLSGQPVWQSLTHTTEQFISSAQWPAGIYLIEIRTEQENHHVWVERMPR